MLLVVTFALLPCLVYALEPLDVQTVRYTGVVNKRLTNHVFNTTNCNDPQQCLADCWAQNDECRSFNFLIEPLVCELNNNTHEDMPEDYVDCTFCVYFQNPLYGQDAPNMARNNFSTGPPDPCSSDPCENGGTCIPHEGLGLRCINCSTGFTGKFCELRVDPCSPNPCGEFTCTSNNNFADFECNCPSYIGGKLCDKFLGEHKYDMEFKTNGPVTSAHMDSSTVLTEMTLCFWYSATDSLSYLFSYVPDDPTKIERIVVWKNDTQIHVSLAQEHEEVFDNYQGNEIQLCITLNTIVNTFDVYMAGAIRNDPKPLPTDSFELHPGTLHLGYYEHPTDGALHSNGFISQLYLWDHLKSASEIKLMTNESCLNGTSKEGLLWDWNTTEWNSLSLPKAWPPESPCAARAEFPKDFRSVKLTHTGSAPQCVKSAVITLPDVLTRYTVSGWIKLPKISMKDWLMVELKPENGHPSELVIKLMYTGAMSVKKADAVSFDVFTGNWRDGMWHHIVLTWTTTSNSYLYTIITDGIFRSHYTNSPNLPVDIQIPAGEYTFYVSDSSMSADILSVSFSNVNMWSIVLPNAYILAMATHGAYDIGDVFAWKDMVVVGQDVTKSMDDYIHDEPLVPSEALHFTNADDAVPLDVEYPPGQVEDLTMCLWLKLVTFSAGDLLAHALTERTGFVLSITQSGDIRLLFDDGEKIDLKTLLNVLLDKWTHICVSFYRYGGAGSKTAGNCCVGLACQKGSNRADGLYPDENYGSWVVKAGQSGGGYIAHLNVWGSQLDDLLMKDMARGYVPGAMPGKLLAWSQVLEVASEQGVSVTQANEIALPDVITQAKRDDFCKSLGNDMEFARTAARAGLAFGWYCTNSDETDANYLMIFNSDDCTCTPQPGLAIIN